ncbi:MAG: DUF362 domain-containing protein [Anaerolineaceae bacterium]|nr:DUF362 domain-containing protein [Anaerolineaceae bacterium]
MARISRREFLKTAAVGLGAVTVGDLLSSCSAAPVITQASTLPTEPEIKPTPSSVDTTIPETETPTVTTISDPDVVVVRNGEPEAMVRKALEALGGMSRFVASGSRVVIKPNICTADYSYEYAATTNPWVVGALVKLCVEAGASSVKVMDYPFSGRAERAYVTSGIAEQVEAAGGEMHVMSNVKYVMTDIPGATDLTQCKIYDDILKADVVIDVPVAKDHGEATLTLGMKNLMGVIVNRSLLHQNLGRRIAELASRIRPALTVIDAVRILTDHGPRGGNLADVKKIDTIIASADMVAADSYATRLFGLWPDDIEYIVEAAAMGLGNKDLTSMKIQEINL